MSLQESPRRVIVVSGISIAVSAIVVVTTVFGVVRNWSPMPWMDTWDGIIRSWYRFQDGDVSALWAQHNDHRIVLSRLLYWFDFVVFDGASWLITGSALLMLALCTGMTLALLKRNLLDSADEAPPAPAQWAVMAMVVLVSWSWLAAPNILWGFEVPFFIAPFLTLVSFTLLAAAAVPRSRGARTWLIAGGIAVAAMAPWSIPTGLITPIVAALLAWATRLGRVTVIALLLVAAASLTLYEIGYDHEAYPLSGFSASPVEFVVFALAYLGGPIVIATGSALAGVMAGIVFSGLTLAWIADWARHRRVRPAALVLAGATLFTLAGTVMVALGRADRGLEAAVPDRYQNLVLFGWACLLALYAPVLVRWIVTRPALGAAALLAFPLLLLLNQPWAIADVSTEKAFRERGALGVALQADDPDVVNRLYPGTGILEPGGRLMADGLTAIGKEPYVGLQTRLGQVVAAGPPDASCTFSTSASAVRLPDGRLRIEAVAAGDNQAHGVYPLIDSTSTIVGFADVQPFTPMTQNEPQQPEPSLLGYVSADATGPLRVALTERTCAVTGLP